jgi:hypothetical protein
MHLYGINKDFGIFYKLISLYIRYNILFVIHDFLFLNYSIYLRKLMCEF